MNALPKISIYILISLIFGLIIDSQSITAEKFNQDFGYFSSGSGNGESVTRTMSVVAGLAVSSEEAESDIYKQFGTSSYSFVNTVNRAPIVSMQTFHLSEIIEDPVDNKGNSIDDILDSNSKHAIIDINLGAQRGIAIIDINHLNGQWEYTTDGQSWKIIDTVSENNALLLAAGSLSTRVRFVPEPDHSGIDNGTLTFRAWDQSRKLENGSFADTRNHGDTSAFSEDSGFANIYVRNVNDPPTASAGNNYTVNEGDNVTLDASNSTDMDDGIASYLWTQTAGISVNLSDQAEISPEFSVPEVDANGAFLSFKLEVSDHEGLTSVDTISIYITNVLKEFHIISEARQGGTISPDGDTIVIEGSNQVYSILPVNAYQIADILVDGISKGPKERFTFWDVNANHTIEAQFKEKPSIDASAGENGLIEPSGKIYVNEGDFQLFKITANEGYKIDDVVVDGVSIGAKSSYYFENVTKNNTITASFKPARFSITVEPSVNGEITPANLVWVTEGKDQTFSIVPSDDYEVASVTIDGQSVGIIDTYTFYHVTENHSMSATFRKMPVITANGSGNGKIEPQGMITVGYDSSQAFTMAPSEGYLIQDVLIDGKSIGPKSSYIFSNIQSDHQISVTFSQPTITATAGENGEIIPSGELSVPSNSDQTFTITPIKEFEIDDVQIDGISIGAVEKPTLWNIIGDHTIHAIFTPLPKYQITAIANTGGKIESEQGESPIEIIRGGFAHFKITPDEGYEIEDVLVNGRSMGIITQYLVKDIQRNYTIQVRFKEIITYTIIATATEGGQISPAGNIVIPEGGYQLFKISANEHYRLTDVKVDYEDSVGPINSYAFTGDKDHTIQAFFKKIIIRSIRGRVIGEDLKDEDKPGLAGYRIEVRQDGVFLADATTDLNGYYTITDMPPESNLIVSAWPPMDNNIYRRMFYNQQASSQTANTVSLTASDLSQIDFMLPKNYQEGIQGRVHDGKTQPKGIANVEVDVFSQDASFGKTAITDEQGYYTIVGLKPENDYRVSVFSKEYNIEFFFAILDNQKPGSPPTFSVFSFDEATPITPTEPLLQNIDIIYNPNQGDSIGGHVFAADGTPAVGIKVNAWSEGLNKGNMSTTDDSGQYTITGLERVLYQNVLSQGYIVEIQPDNYPYQAYNGVTDANAATKVATDRNNIDFHLRAGVTIRGSVENFEGQKLSNVNISAWSESEPELKRSQTITDAFGAYSLTHLPIADDYILAAFPKNYRIQYYDGKDSDIDAKRLDLRYDDLSDLNFHLNKGHIISGNILIEGVPASKDIPVHIWSETTNTGGTVLTDLDGAYEIIGLNETAKDYIISVHAEGYPPAFYRDNSDNDAMNDTVYSWTSAEGIHSDLWNESFSRNLDLTRGYSLTGRITYKDIVVSDLRIDVWNSEIGAWGQTISNSDPHSNYTITGLAPGAYQLNIFSDYYADTEMSFTLTKQDRILDIAIQKPERSISGHVVGIEAFTSVRLNAWSTSENTGKVIVIQGNGNVKSYKISGLKAASDYRMEVISDDYHYQVYKEQTDLESANLIDLSDQNQDEIDFSLEKLPETATIFGKVTFPDDAVSGDRVWIQFQSQALDISKDIQVIFENANVVNYSISGFLFSHDYIAAARSETFLNQYYDNVDEQDNATPIDVKSDITGIDFQFQRGRAISGRIVDDTQSPLVKASVEVWSDKNQTGGYAITDEDGTYRIAGLKQINDFIVWVSDAVRGDFYYAGKKSVRDLNKAKKVNTIPKDQSDIDIFVTQTYSIQGRITSADGQILENVWVDVQSVSSKKGGGVYTNEDGTYKINGLAMGNDYKITVTPERPYIGQEKENISAGDTQVNFILQSQTGVQLSGIVYSSSGNPLEGAKIEVQSATDKDKYALVQTDSKGAYQIENLPKSDDYLMNVWPVENSKDAFYSDQGLILNEDTVKNITLRPALIISGVVTNRDGDLLKNIQITVFSQKANFWKELKTDKKGAYAFNNVSEATDYIVTASSDDYIKQEQKDLSPGTVDFVLEQSGFISGYVREKSSGTGLADVSVEIFSESMKGGEGFGGVATTNDTGFFKVLELKPVDQQGNPLNDYIVFVHANDYPDQSKGGKSVNDSVEFFLSKSVANVLSGTVEKSEDDIVMIDLFETDSGFMKTYKADQAGHFTITALSSEKSYQLRFISNDLGIEQWADAEGKGITDSSNAASFKVGRFIEFSFTEHPQRKRDYYSHLWLGMSKDPMSVRELRSTTHPYVKVSRLRSEVENSGQISNKPNVTIQWKPPETNNVINGYYSSFSTDPGASIKKIDTIDKPPIRTRKITSRDLAGDDVNYYFKVASVDKEGRIGDTQTIAFRIDTVPPTNVSVVPPIETSNRSIDLVLGATGASEMYISNVSYSEGGTWEIRTTKKTWKLPEGAGTKKIYARYRDRANNTADASAITVYEEPVIVYTIDAIYGEHGRLQPDGLIDIEEGSAQVFTLIPDDGYCVDRVLIDEKAINLNELTYTFENVNNNHTIEVQFKRITHRISVTVGDNGQISPHSEEPVEVPLNENKQFTVIPDEGYGIDQVLVDGKSEPLFNNTYTFESVTENHTFVVTFEKVVTIQASSGNFGTLEPTGTITVPEGGFQTIQIIPTPGYEIDGVTVNNKPVSVSGNVYTFLDVKTDQTINVTFRLTKFTITAIASANGHIEPNGEIEVIGGADQNFIFMPDESYEINQILVDDKAVETNDLNYLFNDVTQDHTIAVSFSRINTAPVAKETSVYTDEDVKTTGFMEATDIDGDSLTYQITVPGKLGKVHVVDNTTGEFVYTPTPNKSGIDTITFTASDGKKTSNAGTVLVHINAVNDVPTAINQSVETALSESIHITLRAIDMDGDPIQYNIVKTPEKGKLTGNAPYLTYEPLTEVRAIDEFYFTASDSNSTSYTAIVEITIGNPDADFICDEDTPFTYTIQHLEPDDHCIIVNAPEHGSITVIGRSIIYTPYLDYNGPDQLDYTSENMTENEQLKVYVRPINDAPVINMPLSLTMLEDDAISISVTVTDVENNALKITIDPPPNGEIIGEIPDLQYQPMAGFTGSDYITVHAMDGFESTQKTLHITVQAKNVAPVAFDETFQTLEDQTLSAKLNATDANNDSIYFLLTENPENGKATIVDPKTGAFTYTPNLNFNGNDTFNFKAYDGELDSDIKTITIEIEPVNDPPVAIDGKISLLEDDYVSGALVGYDPDGSDVSPLQFEITRQSTLGNVNITNPATGAYIFKASDDLSGVDSFEFMVIDGDNAAYTSVAVVDVVITPVNDAPRVFGEEIYTVENTPVSITLTANDIDSDITQMVYQITEKPDDGKVTLTGNQLTYTPDPDYWGDDTIKFVVSDGALTSNEAHILIYVGVHKADIFTLEDQAVAFSLPSHDQTGTLTFAITKEPENGHLTGVLPDLTYTPNENFNGDDTLEYTINGTTYQFKIYVRPENDAPVIKDINRTIELQEDTAITLTLIASDVDNKSLEYFISESPTQGLLISTENANSFIYSPYSNFNGQDQVYYQVNDGILSAFGRIIINVLPVNDPPVANKQTVYAVEERSVLIILSGTDIESDANDLTYEIVKYPEHGVLSNAYVYTPEYDYFGKDYLTFRVHDGTEWSEPAKLLINIENINDPPIVVSSTIEVDMSGVAYGSLQFTDPDNDILECMISSQGTKGMAVLSNPVSGDYIYFADIGKIGVDQFEFSVSDSKVTVGGEVQVTIKAPTIEYGILNITLGGHYSNGYPYEYVLLKSETGKIYREGTNNLALFNIYAEKGKYRFLIVAKNFQPFEYCSQEDSKIIEIGDEPVNIQADLIYDATFDPLIPSVEVSHTYLTNGFDLHVIRKNFSSFNMKIVLPDGSEQSVDQNIYTRSASRNGTVDLPYTYHWTTEEPYTKREHDQPETGDLKYLVTFNFYDTDTPNTPVDSCTIIYIEYGSTDSKITHQPDDEKHFEDHYGDIQYISSGESVFYPLIGTTIHILMKDTDGQDIPAEINIPTIPLDYLFVDNQDNLKYDENTDTYQIDPNNSRNVQPREKLRVKITNYTFAKESLGTGVRVEFYLNENETPVYYNPFLDNSNKRLSDINNEIPPSVSLPILMNSDSDAYTSFMAKIKDHQVPVNVNEKGDGIHGFHTEKLQYLPSDIFIIVQTPHLSSIGLDVPKESPPEEKIVDPYAVEAPAGNCFISVVGGGAFGFFWFDPIKKDTK